MIVTSIFLFFKSLFAVFMLIILSQKWRFLNSCYIIVPYRIFLTGFILFYSLFTCLLYSNREWIKRNFLSLTIIFFSTKTGWYSIVVVKSLRKSHWITFDLPQDEPMLRDGKKVRCKNKVYLKSNIEQKK